MSRSSKSRASLSCCSSSCTSTVASSEGVAFGLVLAIFPRGRHSPVLEPFSHFVYRFRVFERASYRSSHTRPLLSARQHKAHPLYSSVYLEFSDSYHQVLQSQLSCFATLISHIAHLFSATSVQLRFKFLPSRTFLQCLISTALLLRAPSSPRPRRQLQVHRATKMAIMVRRTHRTCHPRLWLRLSSPRIQILSQLLSHRPWGRMEV